MNFSSLGVFKRSIQLVDFSEFLKCTVMFRVGVLCRAYVMMMMTCIPDDSVKFHKHI